MFQENPHLTEDEKREQRENVCRRLFWAGCCGLPLLFVFNLLAFSAAAGGYDPLASPVIAHYRQMSLRGALVALVAVLFWFTCLFFAPQRIFSRDSPMWIFEGVSDDVCPM